MKITWSILLIIFTSINSFSQNALIYSFEAIKSPTCVFERFISFNYNTGQKTTVKDSLNCIYSNKDFLSTIDPFNGRYFYSENWSSLYSYNLNTDSLKQVGFTSEVVSDMEYDIYNNAIYSRKSQSISKLDLNDNSTSIIGYFPHSISFPFGGKMTAFDPYNMEFIFIGYAQSMTKLYTFNLKDSILTDSIPLPISVSALGNLTFNYSNGKLYGTVNSKIVELDNHNLTMDTIYTINDFNGTANSQKPSIDATNDLFLYPYINSFNKSKLAIVNIGNKTLANNIDFLENSNHHEYYNTPIPTLSWKGNSLIAPFGDNYQWFINDTLINNATNQTYKPNTVGLYKAVIDFSTVRLATQNENVSANLLDVTVEESEKVNKLEAYPNPFINFLKITGTLETYDYFIYNIKGQLIINGTNSNNRIKGLNNLENGVYFLKIQTTSQSIIKKIIKMK